MALSKLGKTAFSRCYTSPLPYQYSPILQFAISTLPSPPNSPANNPQSSIDESHVLNQLADLFPISITKSLENSPPHSHLEVRAPDDFLPSEDRLRGVFFQKLRGRTAIHRALTSVGVELNTQVFAEVVNWGYLSGDKIVEFFKWAVEQPGVEKDVSMYNVVIKALGRRKYFKHMMEVFGEMRDKGGVSPSLDTLAIVIDSYVCARQVSKSFKIFRELEKYGLKCDEGALGVVLRCLCRRSHVSAACSLFNKVRGEVQCDTAVYNTLLGGWSKVGRVAEVEKFLKAMMDDGVEPDSVTYSCVIECFGRARKVEDADRIFKFLEEKGDASSTVVYNAMIFNCVGTGDIDGALTYYKQMLSNSVEPNMDTYVRILMHFLNIRRVADAIEMFDEMVSRGLIPATGTVTEIIEPLCSYGPPHAALMIYQKARKAGCRISLKAYKLLLMRLSRFGKRGMLLNMWNEMQESGYSSDTQVYDYIINGLCNSGQLETAVLVMEESIRKGFFPCKMLCSKLHYKLMESNQVEVSYKLFLKLRNARVNENAQRRWRVKGWHF